MKTSPAHTDSPMQSFKVEWCAYVLEGAAPADCQGLSRSMAGLTGPRSVAGLTGPL